MASVEAVEGSVKMRRQLGPLAILPSGRLCRSIGQNRSGNDVFIDSFGKAVCAHGEVGHTIVGWLRQEANGASRADVRRGSPCDCVNSDGLMVEYTSIPSCELPDPGSFKGVFDLLGAIGAEEKVVKTRPQRLALLNEPGKEVWVQPSGALVCAHGLSARTLAAGGRAKRGSGERVSCGCQLRVLRRKGSIFGADGPPRPISRECRLVAFDVEKD